MQFSSEMYPWISAAAIAWGVLDVFYGYKIFKISLALIGGLAGALFGQAAGIALGFGQSGEFGGLFVGALLGGALAYFLFLVAVFIAGFGFGATLGILLLAHYNSMVAVLTGLVLGLVGGVAAIKAQKILLILSTSLLGAFRAVVATAFFTSQVDWFYYFKQPHQIPALITANEWMMPTILVLAGLGVATQFGLTGKSSGKKDKVADDKT